MEKVKWGIIGTGKIAKKFANDMRVTKHATLHAIGSRSLESAKIFADSFDCPKYYPSYEELLADPDVEAVYIATPHTFHFENTVATLNAGKAVLCEKPLTVNVEECEKLIEIAQLSGQYLMEGMWTYFLPSIRKVQEWVNDGKIGRVTNIKADFGFKAEFDPKGRLFNPDLAGGAMLDIGIYPIAITWLMMKQLPQSMKVYGTRAATGVDFTSSFLFEFDEIIAELGCSLQTQLPNSAYIIGTDGYIEIPKFWMSQEAKLYKKLDLVEHFNVPRNTLGYEFEIDAVCEDIRTGRTESEVMPLAYSLAIQKQMALVLNEI